MTRHVGILLAQKKLYVPAKQIQEKVTKLQNTIDADVQKAAEIESMYNALDSEYKSSIQELDN